MLVIVARLDSFICVCVCLQTVLRPLKQNAWGGRGEASRCPWRPVHSTAQHSMAGKLIHTFCCHLSHQRAVRHRPPHPTPSLASLLALWLLRACRSLPPSAIADYRLPPHRSAWRNISKPLQTGCFLSLSWALPAALHSRYRYPSWLHCCVAGGLLRPNAAAAGRWRTVGRGSGGPSHAGLKPGAGSAPLLSVEPLEREGGVQGADHCTQGIRGQASNGSPGAQ